MESSMHLSGVSCIDDLPGWANSHIDNVNISISAETSIHVLVASHDWIRKSKYRIYRPRANIHTVIHLRGTR